MKSVIEMFEKKGLTIPREKPEEHLGISMLQEQIEKNSLLLRQLSNEMGIHEEAEARARAAKLAVASKFSAVEKLLNQTQAAIAVLRGDGQPEAIPKTMTVTVRSGDRRYKYNAAEVLRNAVSALGGEGCSGDIVRKIAEIQSISYAAASALFYKHKLDVIVGVNQGNKTIYRLCERQLI